MAEKINKPLLWKTDEAGTFFIYIFLIFQNRDEATFLQVLKKTDEEHWEPEKHLIFFLSDWNLKKYPVVLVMYSWVQGFL